MTVIINVLRFVWTKSWDGNQGKITPRIILILQFIVSVSTNMYAGAYRYATKNDEGIFIGNVLLAHPNLELMSDTCSLPKKANNTYFTNRNEVKTEVWETSGKGKRKITKGDVNMYIIENNLKTEVELTSATKKAGSWWLCTWWLCNISEAEHSTRTSWGCLEN